MAMSRPSSAPRPGVYTIDLQKPGGAKLSLTHRADSELDAHNRALVQAVAEGWLESDDEVVYAAVTGCAALH